MRPQIPLSERLAASKQRIEMYLGHLRAVITRNEQDKRAQKILDNAKKRRR